jgi:hypothetical protein
VREVVATWRRGIAALADCRNVTSSSAPLGVPRMGFDRAYRIGVG